MRVVHDDEKRLAGPHLLEAAGHRAHAGERPRDGSRLEAKPDSHADRAQEVHDVVLADQG